MVRLFAATLALSALLLFAVQPMLGRLLLPLLGGAPAVWTTVMLFFQAALLLGYAWAHGAGRWLPWRAQVAAHLLLLAIGFALLPPSAAGVRPPSGDGLAPAVFLAGWLTVAVGLPVVAISASAPLLQGWVARAGVRDPYALYAASNAGSLVALLGYPLVIEPFVGVALQAQGWRVGYGGLVVAVLACALVAARAGVGPLAAPGAEPPPPPGPLRLARWLALAAAPVCLLLGVTTHLTSDVSAVPLLWVAPLATYLVTFIVAFDRADLIPAWTPRALAVITSPLVLVLASDATPPLAATVSLDLVALLLAGLVCHGELARDRPHVAHLTRFYLVIAAGGVLGGLLCALLAPLVFSRNLEYPLALIAVNALRPGPAHETGVWPGERRARLLDLASPLAVAAVLLTIDAVVRALAPGADARVRLLLAFGPAAIVAHAVSARSSRHALALVALLVAGLWVDGASGRALHTERSFFGVLRVTLAPDGLHRWLMHGSTVHGAQAVDPARAREPLVYYHRLGPCADVVAAWRASATPRRAGVVGLGVGSLAAYGEPGDTWTFYEIDPAVVRLARDRRYFTFLSDCRAEWSVVTGDGRLELAEAAPGGLGVLFLDAFSGDAIPAHLLTHEALALAVRAVAPGGLVALHVSNRHLDLPPVVARVAGHLGLAAMVRVDDIGEHRLQADSGRTSSVWIVLARAEADLAPLRADPRSRWRSLRSDGAPPWSDDHQNVLGALSFD